MGIAYICMHASGLLQAYYYMLSFRLSSLFERSSTSIPLSCILAPRSTSACWCFLMVENSVSGNSWVSELGSREFQDVN